MPLHPFCFSRIAVCWPFAPCWRFRIGVRLALLERHSSFVSDIVRHLCLNCFACCCIFKRWHALPAFCLLGLTISFCQVVLRACLILANTLELPVFWVLSVTWTLNCERYCWSSAITSFMWLIWCLLVVCCHNCKLHLELSPDTCMCNIHHINRFDSGRCCRLLKQ